MYFLVYDADGNRRCESRSWPMARSALDFLISEGKEAPRLLIVAEPVKRKEDADG